MPDLTTTKTALKKILGLVGDAVGLSDTQTLTNKTINAPSNTLTNIPRSAIPTGIAYEDEANTFTEAQTLNKAAQGQTAETLFTLKYQ